MDCNEIALILGMQTRRGKLSESLCKGSLEVDMLEVIINPTLRAGYWAQVPQD